MADVNEFEVKLIQESLVRFSKKYNELTTRISRSRYDYLISSAETKLSAYVRTEESALKAAQKIIEKGFSGSGFLFSKEGLNNILSKKSEQVSQEVLKILSSHNDFISQIRTGLPKIGTDKVDYSNFDATMYSGDVEIAPLYVPISENDQIQTNENSSDVQDDTVESSTQSFVPQIAESIHIDAPIDAKEWATPDNVSILSPEIIENATIEKLVCTNITEIQANAFKYINGLKLIVISDAIKTININAFRGLANSCIIAFISNKDALLSAGVKLAAIENRNVIFSYKAGDENNDKRVEHYSTPKEICAKPKRITIKASAPLNTIEIKETFLSRNARLNLTMDELERAIIATETDVDKNKILLEALKIKRIRDIRENSFWNYALTLQEIIKLSKSLNLKDEELNAIFGLFYLDSSGYRMINGKYNNPYKQSAEQMYYHPKMQMGDLHELQKENPLSDAELSERYRKSPYVIELSEIIKDAYYSVEDSIKLMLMALKNSAYIFYPAKSGIIRQH